LFLADSNSPHTIRWAKSIYGCNNSVGIFSIHTPDPFLYSDTPDIQLFSSKVSRDIQSKGETNLSKLSYLKAKNDVKKLIEEFEPDLIHSHYASSYGLVGALSGFHPFIISLWGGDVFSFPKKSFIHRSMLKFSLSRADVILSTSYIMEKETKKYTSRDIFVTPFGIDVEKFSPRKVNNIFKNGDIVIGTIKTLEKRYGIEYLIKAFGLLKKKFPEKSLKLLIVGSGTKGKYLESLVNDLNLKNDTIFTGFINHNDVEKYHNMLDIFVAMSLEESFGVAVLEASACGKPVVVSDVGGLPEVVENGKTGFIVERGNAEELAQALEILINDLEKRKNFGIKGREMVISKYNWIDSVNQMISIYDNAILSQ
jgi:glycosyltransferase involved in cell wall biosynthesis